MTHANSVLYAQRSAVEFFVTIFLAILDLPSGNIGYSSAGHPPAAIYRADRSVEFPTFGHPPIGLLEKYGFWQSESNLKPGDKIVFYTDGISEARRDTEIFGTERIAGSLREHGYRALDDVIGALLAAAKGWAYGRLTGDAAIVVIERSRPHSAEGGQTG